VQITGNTLISWGYKPGPWFKQAIAAAETARRSGADEATLRAIVAGIAPPQVETAALRARGELAHRLNIRAESPEEEENVASVE
jgi:tRNA-splicing ligase RtcB (3'-phosphate/5'-hydroxy nucleic acid ligase)